MRKPIFVRPRRLTLIGLVLAAGIVAASGYVIAVAASSVTASATDTIVQSTANTNLSTTGGVETTILTLTLPGSATSRDYVLTASGDVVNFGPSDYTRCQIFVNTTQIAAVAMIVGDPSATGARGPAGFLSTFAEVGGVTIPAGTASETATLQCEHDTSNGATPYVDAGASLTSHRTKSLLVATEP